jgi:hypothetical protein
MTDWYSSVYKAFLVAGIIAFIVGIFSSGDISINAYISGYVIIILGIMMLLIFLINNSLKPTPGLSSFALSQSILMTIGPFLLMLGVISFILYLLINYRTNIVEQKVSSGYYTFSNISVILLLIQLYIVYINVNSQKFFESGKLTKVTTSIIYLLGVLGTITSIILYTMLRYFTTDGYL